MKACLAIATTLGVLAAASAAQGRYYPVPWPDRRADAIELVEARAGVESFAVVDEDGRLHGFRRGHTVRIASLLKPMLLLAYLNRASVRDRGLTASERSLLASMIRWSDDRSAETVLRIVGSSGLNRIARRAEMTRFRFHAHWGWSETTAADQARFFHRIDSYVPRGHRAFVRYLLSHIVPSQSWGIPTEAPAGWTVFFKGGWSTGTGRVTHQVALLKKNGRRLSVAILTERNPSHEYGVRTIRRVAARLLRVPLPGPTPYG